MITKKWWSRMIALWITGIVMLQGKVEASEAADTALSDWIQTLHNDQNGLPTGEANAVLQTKDGYLWIGGYGGLVRYDGKEFRNFCLEESGLTSFGIRALYEDSRGRLLVGTNDQGTFLYQDGRFTACEKEEAELYNSVRCFAEDAEGNVYVGTATGLAKMNEKGEILPVKIQNLENQTVYTISFDENGILWGTAGSGNVFALKKEKEVYWFEPEDLGGNDSYSILAVENNVYIGTAGNRLLCLTMLDAEYGSASYQVESYETGEISTINALCYTREGELWVGSNTGTGWFDASMTLHTVQEKEPISFVNGIVQDYEGSLWFASTRSGVFQLTAGKYLHVDPGAGLSGQSVNASARVAGELYLACNNGLSILDSSWEPVENALTQLLKGTRVRHVSADSRGNLWVGTYSDFGVIRYTPATGETVSVSEKDGLLSNQIRKIMELRDGRIAVAGMRGIDILQGTEIVESYGRDQGLVNPVVLCMLECSDGTLMAGSDGMGIYAIREGQIDNYSKESGLTSGVVLRMREDQKAGGIWISAGSDLFFMDANHQVRKLSNFHGGIGSVFDIQVMEEDIWLMKSSGVIIVPREQLLANENMQITQYGRESGLGANISANSWSLYQEGVLYLCTVDGLFLLDKEYLSQGGTPPKTVVNEVKAQLVNGQYLSFTGQEPIVLPSDTKRLTVRFACLSFQPAPCTVQYELEDFDKDPVIILSDRAGEVSYTNLRGGEYTFRLTAGRTVIEDNGAKIELSIQKELTLWEKPVTWAVAAVVLILLVLLAVRITVEIKTRKMKRRQQEYRDITEQALRTIANTIDAKDKYTNGHSVRVAGYSRELARRLSLSSEEQEKIYYMALLHDIGKIGIPDAILNKSGKLTDEEYEVMRGHTRIGSGILKDFTALPQIGDGALYHHENYNGTGYPEHIRAGEIPLVARIIRAADSYDAMATKRAYRKPMDKDYILKELHQFSGIEFEPDIAAHLVNMIAEGFLPDQEIHEENPEK